MTSPWPSRTGSPTTWRAGALQRTAREIALDTERAAQLFSAPQLVPDRTPRGTRLQRELQSRPADENLTGAGPGACCPRRARFPTVSLRAGLAMGAVGIVVVGTAAAATLTTVFAPTHIAPVSLSQSDVRAIAAFTGLGDSQVARGFSPRTDRAQRGSEPSRGPPGAAHPSSSLARPPRMPAFRSHCPRHLPAGVGAPSSSWCSRA